MWMEIIAWNIASLSGNIKAEKKKEPSHEVR